MKSKTIDEVTKEVSEKYFSLSLEAPIEISIYDRGIHEYLIEDLPIKSIDCISYFLRNYEIETYMLSQYEGNIMRIKFFIDLNKETIEN